MDFEVVDRIVRAFALCEDERLLLDPRPLAKRIINGLEFRREMRWIPYLTTGESGEPLPTMQDAELMMRVTPNLARVEREFRIVSKWIKPLEEL